MSIILKGIDMPRNCFECKFGMYDYSGLAQDLAERKKLHKFECVITGKTVTSTKRNRFCPLIQIPNGHGDIKDINTVEDELDERCGRLSAEIVRNAPTILEAGE